MAKIEIEDVEHGGELARIKIDKEQIASFASELEKILNYIENLEHAPTENVEVIQQITGLSNIFREDKIVPGLLVEKVLQNTSEKQGNFIKTKPVFE